MEELNIDQIYLTKENFKRVEPIVDELTDKLLEIKDKKDLGLVLAIINCFVVDGLGINVISTSAELYKKLHDKK